jgi:hypothetical protein
MIRLCVIFHKLFAKYLQIKTKILAQEYLQDFAARVVVENKTEQLTQQDVLQHVIIVSS